jgi:hypothetical protein
MSERRTPSHATRHRARTVVAVAICLLATSVLVACSPQGNAANKWMRGNPIVESSSMHLNGCEAMCEPTVEAKIKDSATDDQVRQLARDSASYLAEQNGLRIDLKYHDVSVSIDKSVTATSRLADSLLTLIHDPKVSGGIVFVSGLYISTSKDQVVSVYKAHSFLGNGTVTVSNLTGNGEFSVSNSPLNPSTGEPPKCATNEALLSVATDLMSDSTVTSLNASMCGDTHVEASDFPSVNRIAANLQLRTSDPALTVNRFSVRHDGSEFTSEHVVTAATAAYAPYTEFLNALPGVTEYGTDVGSIVVGPVDPAKFTAVMTAIDAEPRPAGVQKVLVIVGNRSIYYANSDGTLPAQLAVNDAIEKLGVGDRAVSVSVSPTEMNLVAPGYTRGKARQLVDAVLASGLWKTRPTKIQFLGHSTTFTVEWGAGGDSFTASGSDGSSATQKLIDDIRNYWAIQSR